MRKIAEEWRDIEQFKGEYQISNFGRIRNYRTKKVLKNYINPEGYICNSLRHSKEERTHTVRVHRLIAEAFIPNPNNYPIINHIDGNKQNNNIENLEWCTAQHNIQHSFDNGLQEPTNIILVGYDYVIAFAMYLNGFLYGEIVERLGNKVKDRAVYQALKRKTYLRWYSEDDFKNKVDNLRKQLPVKKPYRAHNRLNLL
jgi:hypothetical protein